MDIKDSILQILRSEGPCVPSTISKKISQNTLITSSLLSELSSEGKVKITSVKFGSSPFYYVPEHANRLEALSKHLNEKDLRTFELLKSQKVLKESELDPLTRVSVQSMKDFSIPLRINFKGVVDVFWRYFVISQDEAVKILKERYYVEEKKEEPISKVEPKAAAIEKVEVKKADIDKTEVKAENKNIEKVEKKAENNDNKVEKQEEIKKVAKETIKTIATEKQEKIKDSEIAITQNDIEESGFIADVMKKFSELKIKIIKYEPIRKNSEYDMVIELMTTIGKMKFYCKAKSKKRINDGDLSSAFIISQSKKLPCLFVTTGKLTKKAEEMYQTEFKNNYTVLEI